MIFKITHEFKPQLILIVLLNYFCYGFQLDNHLIQLNKKKPLDMF